MSKTNQYKLVISGRNSGLHGELNLDIFSKPREVSDFIRKFGGNGNCIYLQMRGTAKFYEPKTVWYNIFNSYVDLISKEKENAGIVIIEMIKEHNIILDKWDKIMFSIREKY